MLVIAGRNGKMNKPKNNTMYTWDEVYKNNWTPYKAFSTVADEWSRNNMPNLIVLKHTCKSVYQSKAAVEPLNNIDDADERMVFEYAERIFGDYYLYYRKGEQPGNNCHMPLGIIVSSRMSLRDLVECDFCEDSPIYGAIHFEDDYRTIKSKFNKKLLDYHYAYEGVKEETLNNYKRFQRMIQCK